MNRCKSNFGIDLTKISSDSLVSQRSRNKNPYEDIIAKETIAVCSLSWSVCSHILDAQKVLDKIDLIKKKKTLQGTC